MSTTTLSSAAADALRTATADATSVRLTCGQLDPKTYKEVNKALERIAGGGKWNRKAQAHLYTEDPRHELADLVGDGSGCVAMPVDRDKEASFWRTPDSVVDQMMTIAGLLDEVPSGHAVLEPSAGDGAIADTIRRCCPRAQLTCVEFDLGRAATLHRSGHAVRSEPFETFATTTRLLFDAILMNPPFTLPGDSTAWATHLDLALDLLAPGGVVVAVVPNSYETRQTRKLDALRSRVSALAGWYDLLPDDAFLESGTAVRTGLVVARVPA